MDLWVRVSPALAGGQERTAYLHPGSDGGLRMCDVSADERIAYCRRAGRGISAQVHAMYPKMRPRLHRHPPQAQQGYEEARGALLGGLGNGAGAGGFSLRRRGPSTGAASSSLGSVAVPAVAAVAAAVSVFSAAPGADVPAVAVAYGYVEPVGGGPAVVAVSASAAASAPPPAAASAPAALVVDWNVDGCSSSSTQAGTGQCDPYNQARHWREPYEP